ncbi:MAG: hypothetical protein SGPRY_010869, partial [Prymnesium sp.]
MPMPLVAPAPREGLRREGSADSLVSLAGKCALDERQDLAHRPAFALARPKSKPSELDLSEMEDRPQKKKRT